MVEMEQQVVEINKALGTLKASNLVILTTVEDLEPTVISRNKLRNWLARGMIQTTVQLCRMDSSHEELELPNEIQKLITSFAHLFAEPCGLRPSISFNHTIPQCQLQSQLTYGHIDTTQHEMIKFRNMYLKCYDKGYSTIRVILHRLCCWFKRRTILGVLRGLSPSQRNNN